MTEWRPVTLAGVSERVDYGYTASASDDATLPRFVRVTDIAKSRLNWSQVPGCEIEPSKFERYALRSGDLVIARSGSVGFAKMIRRGHPPAVFASYLVRFRPDRAVVDPSFLAAVVESTAYRQYVLRNTGGAAQPNANARVLGSYQFVLPDDATQGRIGYLANCLHHLIENNQRRIELLEQMAQAIYREWFVHFRYPGHERVRLVDSPLGHIPEHWQVGTTAQIVETITRGIAPKYADDGPWTILNQKCIRDQRVSLNLARRQERSVPSTKTVRFGDVLVNSTGVGTLGRAALFLEHRAFVTVDSHVTIIRPPDQAVMPWFGLNMLARQSEFQSLGTGSTGQTELSRSNIGALSLVIPEQGLLQRFADSVWPLLLMVPQLLESNCSLASVRDLLLPKLVTGQVDVSKFDLDALVESVA